MTKTISTGLQTHMAGEVTTLATIWKLTRQDGTVYGFTDHDKDITYSGVTYLASGGYLPSALSQTGNLAVDNLDVQAFLESTNITEADLMAGLYDYASIDVSLINYANTTDGVMILAGGWKLGEVTVKNNNFVAEVRSKAQHLQQNIVDLYSPDCRTDLGSTQCQIELEPSTWLASHGYIAGEIVVPSTYDGRRYIVTSSSGDSDVAEPVWDSVIGNQTTDNDLTWTAYDSWYKQDIVSASTDRNIFTCSGLSTYANDYFNYGKVVWLSTAANAPFEKEVKDWTSTSYVVTLYEKMPYTISSGESFRIFVGCNKFSTTCVSKFDNILNFRGEPHIPGVDQIIKSAGNEPIYTDIAT